MRVIYKYALTPGFNYVNTHEGAKVLHVAEQHGSPQVWMEVDTSAPQALFELRAYPTGGYVDEGWEHVATWLMNDGALVWHLYAPTPPPEDSDE